MTIFKHLPVVFPFIVCISVVQVISHAPTQFDEYIYDLIPLWFWLLLAFNIVICYTLVWYKRVSEINLLFTLLITNCMILLIPAFQGHFFFGSADSLTHLGEAKSILKSGQLQEGFLYPTTHILLVQLSYLLGLSPEKVAQLIWPCLLTCLYTLGAYSMSQTFIKNTSTRINVVFMLLCAAFLLQNSSFHYSVVPNGLALHLLPLVIIAVYKSKIEGLKRKRLVYSLAAVLLVVALVVLHILAAAYFLVLVVIQDAYSRMRGRQTTFGIKSGSVATPFTTMAVLLTTVLIGWFSGTAIFGSTINRFFLLINGELQQSSNTLALSSSLARLGGVVELFRFVFSSYGSSLLLIGVAGLMVVAGIVTRKFPVWNIKWMVLFAGTVFLFLVPPSAASSFRTVGFGFRSLGYLVIVSLVVLLMARGFVFHKTTPYFALGLLVFSWFTVFPSRNSLSINENIRSSEIQVVQFLVENTTSKTHLMALQSEYWYRMVELAYGSDVFKKYPHLSKYANWSIASDQFIEEINGETTRSEEVVLNAVLVYRIQTIKAYSTIWRQVQRYAYSDLERLISSKSVVYMSGPCSLSSCLIKTD